MGAIDEDLQYLREVAQGDEKALVRLMNSHKEALFHFTLRYLGNEADAAEITEQTFFRVFQKAHTFKPKGKVKTWIFSIALNLCRDLLRKQKKHRVNLPLQPNSPGRQETPALEHTLKDKEPDPSKNAISTDEIDRIEGAIQKLPEKLRFPFIFCVLESQSHDACAEILRTNRKTIEMRIYRARNQLREILSR